MLTIGRRARQTQLQDLLGLSPLPPLGSDHSCSQTSSPTPVVLSFLLCPQMPTRLPPSLASHIFVVALFALCFLHWILLFWSRLASKSSTPCLYLPGAGMVGVHHRAQRQLLISSFMAIYLKSQCPLPVLFDLAAQRFDISNIFFYLFMTLCFQICHLASVWHAAKVQ